MKKHTKVFILLLATTTIQNVMAQKIPKAIYQNKSYSLTADGVRQGKFSGKILSASQITSDYKSPAQEYLNPSITFKFSINGKDNEMIAGQDHHFNCIAKDGKASTPIITFGKQYLDNSKVPEGVFLKEGTLLTIKVDCRAIVAEMNSKGFYTTFNGDKIFKDDFHGIYVAGGTSPLIWDFNSLHGHNELKLSDADNDGIYEVTLRLGASEQSKIASEWKLSKDISSFPQYQSQYPISDALYKLATEEMLNAIEKDSTLRTGKEWAGVWTRDVSYSIILSMAHLQPKVAMNSLLRKVKNERIIQDTGTGGAYPASTDRMIWAVAAWEIYKVTGDKNWLNRVYTIINNSIEDDLKNIYDAQTGLAKGESSFLDWREQTYPLWMQPADIYESECLGTNAVHYQANIVLAKMATLIGDKSIAEKHQQIASKIKNGINKYLWLNDKGYYGQFLYGKNHKILSPKAEALGEALCVLFGITETQNQAKVIANTPVTDFGINCIFPQIPGIPPYHNNAVWPFVETYWALAAAKAGNEASVLKSIASIYRPATLFLTNKENFVAENGDYAGTQINSSNMLWSLSGNLALVHKILFGIEFKDEALAFHPFVPKALTGIRHLTNFRYRNAILNIELQGHGNRIRKFLLDGKPTEALIPSSLEGKHKITIFLENNVLSSTINRQKVLFAPAMPLVSVEQNKLVWQKIAEASSYQILKNGVALAKTTQTSFTIIPEQVAEYQVLAIDKQGISSFASEPLLVAPTTNIQSYPLVNFAPKSSKNYQGATSNGFVEISKQTNTQIAISINIPTDGWYSLDIRYANGNGPVNTENKCAIRTCSIEEKQIGTFVFPQRGKNEWSAWGMSNAIQTKLTKGKHIIKIHFDTANENMNGDINEAILDYLRIVKLK